MKDEDKPIVLVVLFLACASLIIFILAHYGQAVANEIITPNHDNDTIHVIKAEITDVGNVLVIHDDEYNVTCWATNNGISCIRDEKGD